MVALVVALGVRSLGPGSWLLSLLPVVAGVVSGVFLYAIGVLLAAIGQLLHAHLDTATSAATLVDLYQGSGGEPSRRRS